jgi:hypothetical protein
VSAIRTEISASQFPSIAHVSKCRHNSALFLKIRLVNILPNKMKKLPNNLNDWLNSDSSKGSTLMRPHSEDLKLNILPEEITIRRDEWELLKQVMRSLTWGKFDAYNPWYKIVDSVESRHPKKK